MPFDAVLCFLLLFLLIYKEINKYTFAYNRYNASNIQIYIINKIFVDFVNQRHPAVTELTKMQFTVDNVGVLFTFLTTVKTVSVQFKFLKITIHSQQIMHPMHIYICQQVILNLYVKPLYRNKSI